MWFKKLMGFEEISAENVRNNIVIDGFTLVSKVNKKSYTYGELTTPTLNYLRNQLNINLFDKSISVSEIVSRVENLFCDSNNKNAVFQVASQFNLLEMVGPHIMPENGIDKYEYDLTQGPACAIACGAGTIYRNYFVKVNGKIGQTFYNQIDCLGLIGEKLNNRDSELWKMSNGYALLTQEGLLKINAHIASLNKIEFEELKGNLKVGIQSNTEVTLNENKQFVTQVFCSALPVAYSQIDFIYWESFARLILEATYESIFYVALINYKKTGSNKLFLTLVGGGAFGNECAWIIDSIEKVVEKFKNTPLDIKIVSFRKSNIDVQKLVNKLNNKNHE